MNVVSQLVMMLLFAAAGGAGTISVATVNNPGSVITSRPGTWKLSSTTPVTPVNTATLFGTATVWRAADRFELSVGADVG